MSAKIPTIKKKPRAPKPSRPVPPVTEDIASFRRGVQKAVRDDRARQYLLRLYVTGITPGSGHAIDRVRAICEEHLHGRYELEVIDIFQMPALAKDHQIIATPTLIKVLPTPLRRFIGDFSKAEKVLFGLDLREKQNGR